MLRRLSPGVCLAVALSSSLYAARADAQQIKTNLNALDFGNVAGCSLPTTLVISNAGQANLTIAAITLGGGNPQAFRVTPPQLPQTLPPNATLSVQVELQLAAVRVTPTSCTSVCRSAGSARARR